MFFFSRLFVLLSFSLLGVGGLFSQPSERDLNKEFAVSYLENLTLSLLEREPAVVRSLLSKSEAFGAKKISDYWYWRARFLPSSWRQSQFEWLRNAFVLNEWYREKLRLESAKIFARLAYELDRHQEFVAEYVNWSSSFQDNVEINYYLALSYQKSGEAERARELAERMLFLWADVRYFRILFDTGIPIDILLSRLRFYFSKAENRSPDLLRYLILANAEQPALVENLLTLYLDFFENDYFVAAQRFLLAQKDRPVLAEMFFQNHRTTDFLMISKVLEKIEDRRYAEKWLEELEGLYSVDSDYDGIAEERLHFIKGRLVERRIRSFGTRARDFTIFFNSFGEPERYRDFSEQNGKSEIVEVEYQAYPFVGQVEKQSGGQKLHYKVSAGYLDWKLTDAKRIKPLYWARVPLEYSSLSEQEILKDTYEVALYRSTTVRDETLLFLEQPVFRPEELVLTNLYRFYQGKVIRAQYDENGNGHPEKIVTFQDGMSEIARDIDEDGFFELRVQKSLEGNALYYLDTDEDSYVDFLSIQRDQKTSQILKSPNESASDFKSVLLPSIDWVPHSRTPVTIE